MSASSSASSLRSSSRRSSSAGASRLKHPLDAAPFLCSKGPEVLFLIHVLKQQPSAIPYQPSKCHFIILVAPPACHVLDKVIGVALSPLQGPLRCPQRPLEQFLWSRIWKVDSQRLGSEKHQISFVVQFVHQHSVVSRFIIDSATTQQLRLVDLDVPDWSVVGIT